MFWPAHGLDSYSSNIGERLEQDGYPVGIYTKPKAPKNAVPAANYCVRVSPVNPDPLEPTEFVLTTSAFPADVQAAQFARLFAPNRSLVDVERVFPLPAEHRDADAELLRISSVSNPFRMADLQHEYITSFFGVATV